MNTTTKIIIIIINNNNNKVNQNTGKSPGDLRRLAVTWTSVKDHQLVLVRKTHKE